MHRTTASGHPPDLTAEQISRLANRRLLTPSGEQPDPHPDVLFALGLAPYPLTSFLALPTARLWPIAPLQSARNHTDVSTPAGASLRPAAAAWSSARTAASVR